METDKNIAYYNENAQVFFEGTIQADMAGLYAEFLPLIPKGGHILDAGCGSGRDSLAFLKMGYEVTSFDASEEMVRMSTELTREAGGQPTRLMRFEELKDVPEYDGIWACASLLHVPETMMKDVMSRLVRALKPGGVLFVSFKYGDGEMERKGRMFTMVSEETLRGYISGLPVEEVKVWTTQDVREGRLGEKWVSGVFTYIKGFNKQVESDGVSANV